MFFGVPLLIILNMCYREAYSRMGINFHLNYDKRGYYPKGGGEIQSTSTIHRNIKSILFSKRKTNRCIKLICSFSKLPNK